MWPLLIDAFLPVSVAVTVAPPARRPDDHRIPEIVVTGERAGRSLKDTSSSVVVVGAQDIERSAPDRVDQLLEMIPNVQIGSGGEAPTIRGQDTTGPARDLPAFLGGTRPRTTLVVDGRAVGFNEFVFGVSPSWDLDRLEVFRSPQTTTQGQNSIAGAIFVTTKSPTFVPEYRARAIVADFGTRQLSAVASGPLSDTIALRIAGDVRSSRPTSKIADLAVGASPDHDRHALVRFKLLARPATIANSRVELTFAHLRSQAPQIEGIRQPFRERRDPLATYGVFRTSTTSLTGTLRLQPKAGLALNNVVSGGLSRIQRFAPNGLGETRVKTADWSGESVADWAPSDRLRLIGGASFRVANLRQAIDLSQLIGTGDFDDRQRALGLFGEGTWELGARSRIALGLRYQRDSQIRTGAIGSGPARIDLDYRRTFTAWLPKLTLSHDVTPSLRAGILVQRAYNPGGTTLRFDTGRPDDFDAETLWDYEMFARARLLGGALTVNANAFFYDMRNAQRAQPIRIVAPTGPVVGFAEMINLRKARSHGLEGDVDWRLSEQLSLRVGLGLLATKIVDAGPGNGNFDGKEFQRAPRMSASAAVEWRPLDGLSLSARMRRSSDYFSDDLNDPIRRIDRWTRVDARADWRVGRVELFGYVRNLFDNFYLTYVFVPPSLATAGDPREFGVGAGARF